MVYKKPLRGIAQYMQGTSREAEVNEASPHRLIQMLMEAALGHLSAAKGDLERKDDLAFAQHVSRAQRIITELRTSLDFEKGQEVAITLNSLYDYMGRRLAQAGSSPNGEAINEVMNLMKPVKEAWDEIKEEEEKILGDN